jgi:hypothetical protein
MNARGAAAGCAIALMIGGGLAARAARSRSAGRPCPTWTVREGFQCLARPWVLPNPDHAIRGARLSLGDLAVDGSGLGLAVWHGSHEGRTIVEVGQEQRDDGPWLAPTSRMSRRDPAQAIPGSTGACTLAAGPDGSALVAWVEAAGVYASARDASGAWHDPTAPDVLSFPPAGIEPHAAISPTGEQLVTWCQGTSTGWGVAIAHRPNATAPWVRPANADDVVSPPILFANEPRLATGAHGEAIVAWYQSEGAPLMTYASERPRADRLFSHPGAHDHLSPLGGPVASEPIANPKPALGPHGEAAVVWVQETGPGTAAVYLATRDVSGAWTRPRDATDAFSRRDHLARSAQIVFGIDGELFVVWVEADADRSVVVGARRSAEGVWVETGLSPVRLSSEATTPHRAFDPVLVTGPEGGVLAAWLEVESKAGERVAARRTGVDRATWEALEWLTPSGSGHVRSLRAAMGPGDRALVGWVSGLAGDRIAIARIDALSQR